MCHPKKGIVTYFKRGLSIETSSVYPSKKTHYIGFEGDWWDAVCFAMHLPHPLDPSLLGIFAPWCLCVNNPA